MHTIYITKHVNPYYQLLTQDDTNECLCVLTKLHRSFCTIQEFKRVVTSHFDFRSHEDFIEGMEIQR